MKMDKRRSMVNTFKLKKKNYFRDKSDLGEDVEFHHGKSDRKLSKANIHM